MVMMWPYVFSLRKSTIAASEVLLPEPVAPTKMTRPRLVSATSLSTCGRFSVSMVGSVCGIVRITRPTLPCCTKALTRKRPMPCGEMAKLHSLVRSNSAACLSFITARVSASVCAPVSGCGDTLVTLPSTLMAGGKSAVRKRSEPLRLTISRSRSLTNLDAWSRSMSQPFVLLNRGSFRGTSPSPAPRPARPRCVAPGRRGSGRASACPCCCRSGSTSTSARSCSRGSGCGWPPCPA